MNPIARRSGLIIQVIGPDTVVYDQARDAVHSLNPVAGYVFEHCDGTRSIELLAADMSAALGVPNDRRVVEAALWQLERNHLLDTQAGATPGPVDSKATPRTMTRRQAVRRLGATAIALPVITTILTPSTAFAHGVSGSPSSLSLPSPITPQSPPTRQSPPSPGSPPSPQSKPWYRR